jgi:DNA replication factor GINS
VRAVEEYVDLRLQLAELEYLTEAVRVIVLKNLPPVTIDGTTYDLRKGVELEMPRWLAEVLQAEGVVEKSGLEISLEDAARVHFSAMNMRSPSDLEPLPRHFYVSLKKQIERLDRAIRERPTISDIELRHKLVQYLSEIVERRLMMILYSIRSPAVLAELSSRLSPEEQFIQQLVYRSIEAWRERILPKEHVLDEDSKS